MKIQDMCKIKYNFEIINNCFFVDKINSNEMKAIPLESIFDEIIKRANEEDLIIEFKNENIVVLKAK